LGSGQREVGNGVSPHCHTACCPICDKLPEVHVGKRREREKREREKKAQITMLKNALRHD